MTKKSSRTPGPPKGSAAHAYGERSRRNAELLARVGRSARAHAKRAAAHPLHWGYVGDLDHLEELLLRALASVGGRDDEDGAGDGRDG